MLAGVRAMSLAPIPQATEREFQRAVIDLAHLYGWRVAHFRSAPTRSGGFATPVAADGCGWPDLVLCRERLVIAELKARRGQLRGDQRAWLDALAAAGAEVYLWRPADWPAVVATLSAQGRPVGGSVS